MMRRLAPPTRYTLGRNTASIRIYIFATHHVQNLIEVKFECYVDSVVVRKSWSDSVVVVFQ